MSALKLNFGLLVAAMVASGKKVFESSFQVVAEFGQVRVTDAIFGGRRTNADNGSEYILLRDGQKMVAIGLAKGTPKGANVFEIKQLECMEDVTIGEQTIVKGTKSFKAYAVIEEEE